MKCLVHNLSPSYCYKTFKCRCDICKVFCKRLIENYDPEKALQRQIKFYSKEDNKEKKKEYSKKYLDKRGRNPCKLCGDNIPRGIHGRQYCSKQCQNIVAKEQENKRRIEAQNFLTLYKITRGCDRCGYKKCAGALDFHHRDPSHKSMRISAKRFKN